jgi:hypothetical protein
MEFTIDPDYLWAVFQQQKGRCPYSGIVLKIPTSNNKSSGNASLDRIDNKLGYVYGNVQWVEKRINAMKSNLPESEFLELCRLVAENAKST